MGMVISLHRATPAEIAHLKAFLHTGDFNFKHDDVVYFDKAWHALHCMLTGSYGDTHSPLGIIMSVGKVYGGDQYGMGGVTIISPEEMRAFDEALKDLDDETLASRFDPAAMLEHDIYLAEAFTEEGALDYILQSVPDLRRFSAACANAGDGAVQSISA